MNIEELECMIKDSIEKWTGIKVRCVDLYCGDEGIYEYIAVLDDGTLYDGAVVYGDIIEGRRITGEPASAYIKQRILLATLLDVVMQECYDEDDDELFTKFMSSYEDAFEVLEKFGVIKYVEKRCRAKITEYGKMISKPWLIDLLDKVK